MDPAVKIEQRALSRQARMNAVIDQGDSPIQQFYCGATVFVTGGSGFIGKHFIEKFIRSCDLNKIYILLRSKKGRSINERLETILKDPLFDLLRKKRPNFSETIVPVEGNVADIKLGLREEDWNMLTSKVDTIVHMAATVRFDESLRDATLTNVRGTQETLKLARQCKHLQTFTYVSTAYCHATEERIDKEVLEQFYQCPVSPRALIDLVESAEPSRLENITSNLIKGWPNTYTFTKAVAEELIRTADDLPMCVVRPPIVTACEFEPNPGWLDQSALSGPSGIILGIGLGIIRVFCADRYKKLAMIPLDYVTNTIIAAGWDSAVKRRSGNRQEHVYSVANEKSQVTWELLARQIRAECSKINTARAIWYSHVIESKYWFIYFLLTALLHYIPAYLIDFVCYLTQKKPKQIKSFVDVYNKADKLSHVYHYFSTNEWRFRNDNVKAMLTKMSEKDKDIFECDIDKIDFKEYVLIWCIGIRKYIIKDGLKDSKIAAKRQRIFKFLHYLILPFYLYSILSILFLPFIVIINVLV